MLSLANCIIKGRQIDPKCAEADAFRKKKRANRSPKGSGALAGKHASNESASVRLFCAQNMGSFLGINTKAQTTLLGIREKETHAAVTRALLRALGARLAGNPAVAQVVMAHTKHASPMVRIEALGKLPIKRRTGWRVPTALRRSRNSALKRASWRPS